MGQYVANGQLIRAAVIAGYLYRRIPGSLNAIFGMTSRSITLLRHPR